MKIYYEKVSADAYNCYITAASNSNESEISILDFNQRNTFNVVDVTDEQLSTLTEIL